MMPHKNTMKQTYNSIRISKQAPKLEETPYFPVGMKKLYFSQYSFFNLCRNRPVWANVDKHIFHLFWNKCVVSFTINYTVNSDKLKLNKSMVVSRAVLHTSSQIKFRERFHITYFILVLITVYLILISKVKAYKKSLNA